ncbi:hypothetical protein, partial [Staphylococcus sp. HMSC077H01]|uniref:hypothetical protein n=1 Tax=Staphylococcus sp. HMSC077H01 TaxID=1715206 RepID=UPI001C5933F3
MNIKKQDNKLNVLKTSLNVTFSMFLKIDPVNTLIILTMLFELLGAMIVKNKIILKKIITRSL